MGSSSMTAAAAWASTARARAPCASTSRPMPARRSPAPALHQRRGRAVGRLVGRRLHAGRRSDHPLLRRRGSRGRRLDDQPLRHRAADPDLPAVLPGRVAQRERLRPRPHVPLQDDLQQRGDDRVAGRPLPVHRARHAALAAQRGLRLRLHPLRLAVRPAQLRPETRPAGGGQPLLAAGLEQHRHSSGDHLRINSRCQPANATFTLQKTTPFTIRLGRPTPAGRHAA